VSDPRPLATAQIDHTALAHNVSVVRSATDDTPIMAVVKADAYGHGELEISRSLLASGVRELGVCTVAEALRLRRGGITAPVLSWLNTIDADLVGAVQADVQVAVASPTMVSALVDAAGAAGRTAVVTVKFDSGLFRNGITADEWPEVLADLVRGERAGALRLHGMMTHFACADQPGDPSIERQAAEFAAAVARAREAGLDPQVLHAANSAATLTRPDLHLDMVRPGIALYGISPMPEVDDFDLRPVMRLSGRLVRVKKARAGERVSYGHTWTVPEDTVLGVVPLGYADGVRRGLSGRFHVRVAGADRPAVGRVCMDQFVVDLGADTTAAEGDEVVLFGDPRRGEPAAQRWADLLDTIGYEMVTGIGSRVTRRHTGGIDGR